MENKAYIIIKLQGKADEINEKYKNSTNIQHYDIL